MLNFSQLPQSNPYANSLPDAGVYRAKITEAEMRKPKTDATKPDYLNLKLSLFNKDGSDAGTVYDIISESDSQLVQFKAARFVRACGIPLVGSMELRDLAKLVVGKQIVVDISHDKRSDTPRAQVDLFSREAYYLPTEYDTIYAIANPAPATEEEQADFVASNASAVSDSEIPFDALDGGASTLGSNY